MATLTWIVGRHITTPAILSTVAIGLISSVAILGRHHVSHARARCARARKRAAEMECRYMVASWMADPDDPVWVLFDTKDNARGTTAH